MRTIKTGNLGFIQTSGQNIRISGKHTKLKKNSWTLTPGLFPFMDFSFSIIIFKALSPFISTFWTCLTFWRQRRCCSANSFLLFLFFLQAASGPVCLSHPRQTSWCCCVMLLFANIYLNVCSFFFFYKN